MFDSRIISRYDFLMQIVMNLIYCIALVLYSPKIIYRRLFENRYREGWRQRRGFIDRRCPDKPCIWIHAVSVGEVNAARTLIDELRRQMPNYEVVLSSTTDTGLARAKSQYEKDLSVFYFPLDFSWTMRRAFDRLRPALILLMELEVWPNMAAIAAKRGIPVVVVNGRLSDKSFPRYKKIRWLVQRMFGKVAFVLAQTEEYARRFIELGCQPHKVIVTSSLKYDTAQTEGPVCGADRLAQQIRLDKEPLWVAGGTGPGEEKIALNVFAKLRQDSRLAGLRLAIIPRKPERFDEVAALIEQAGMDYVRYSVLKGQNAEAAGKPAVILGDTMGDLKKFYALATVVFVGRSLVPMGGSDMMEPAALGKCTIFGPHTFNFKQTVEVLLEGGGAVEAADEKVLYEKTLQCLTDPAYASGIAAKGQAVIRQNQGATKKTLETINRLLKQ